VRRPTISALLLLVPMALMVGCGLECGADDYIGKPFEGPG
jgi:hypothetical protein